MRDPVKKIVLHIYDEGRQATPTFLFSGNPHPQAKQYADMGRRIEKVLPFASLIAFNPDFLFGYVTYFMDPEKNLAANPLAKMNDAPMQVHYNQITNGSFTIPLGIGVSILKAVDMLPSYVSEVPAEKLWSGHEVVKVMEKS